ncbi:hypothetical protein [Nocardioides sp. zg-DK7169]|uniref:hypothetical protein n=1 Tax=Nocardioides sp. zg-DK7169 TaxID=2736600 RepID=UPI001552C1B5|nr:hypothetical protein [Nocardioides sp. zg-DK7169]NPC98079.1 hypothetical protein [Nocardioides sp. zg-DK7169]
MKYAQAFRRADERRYRQWQDQIEEALDAIAQRTDGLDVDALFADDNFVDAIATATRIAEKSAADIKRAALQNALFNVAVGDSLEGDKRAIYLRYIDELTPSHLALLRLADDPPGWFSRRNRPWPGGNLIDVVIAAFPTWSGDEAFIDTIAGDLASRGLAELPLRTMMTANGVMAQRTKSKGREFMRFISGPFD